MKMTKKHFFKEKLFFKEAKALTLASMSKENAIDYKIVNFSLTTCGLSFVFFVCCLIGLSFEPVRHTAGLSAICSFFIFLFFLFVSFFAQPSPSFYNDTLEEIINNVKKLKRKQLEKYGDSEISPAMHYWGISQSFKKDKNAIYFESLEKFSKALPLQINDQDSHGNTIMHRMLMDDPDSPFIPTALLLNADIHIENKKGISVYQLIKQQKTQYLDFINKSMTIAEKNTLSDTIFVSSSKKIPVNRI